jgi:hypothetical protein
MLASFPASIRGEGPEHPPGAGSYGHLRTGGDPHWHVQTFTAHGTHQSLAPGIGFNGQLPPDARVLNRRFRITHPFHLWSHSWGRSPQRMFSCWPSWDRCSSGLRSDSWGAAWPESPHPGRAVLGTLNIGVHLDAYHRVPKIVSQLGCVQVCAILVRVRPRCLSGSFLGGRCDGRE